jgi:hypothetical protein
MIYTTAIWVYANAIRNALAYTPDDGNQNPDYTMHLGEGKVAGETLLPSDRGLFVLPEGSPGGPW